MLLKERDHFRVWIRNRIHLLTADSLWIVKIQEDLLVLRLRLLQSRIQILEPLNRVCHRSSFAAGICLSALPLSWRRMRPYFSSISSQGHDGTSRRAHTLRPTALTAWLLAPAYLQVFACSCSSCSELNVLPQVLHLYSAMVFPSFS